MFTPVSNLFNRAWNSWGAPSVSPAPYKPIHAKAQSKKTVDIEAQKFTKPIFEQKATAPLGSSANASACNSRIQDYVPFVGRVAGLFRNKLYSYFKGAEPSEEKEIKECLSQIGTKEISFTTESNVPMRAYSLKAEDFSKSVSDAGLRYAKITVGEKNFSALECPNLEKHKDFQAFYQKLGKLGICDSRVKDKSGGFKILDGQWRSEVINGKVYLIPANKYTEFKAEVKTELPTIETSSTPMKPVAASHTVVLSGGIFSHMDSHRMAAELAVFAMQGLNVVMVADKNLGVLDSESKQHVNETRDALVDYMQKNGIDTNNLIWKGTCFGSHSSVEAAAKHGGAVIIDQGYFDTESVAIDYTAKTIGQTLASAVMPIVLQANDFDSRMDHLKDVKGPICIIANSRDEMISNEQLDKMIDHAGKGTFVPIDNESIKHGGAWYKDQAGFDLTLAFLRKNGFIKQNLFEAQSV